MEHELSGLLLSNGWHEGLERESCYTRSHRIDDYVWTECIDLIACKRISYLQTIKQKRSRFERAVGEAAQKYAHTAGELLASTVPLGRLSMMTKLAAYSQGYEITRSVGKLLSQDEVDTEKLFMIIHQSVELEIAITADSMPEAFLHVKELQRLSGMGDQQQ